MGSKACIVPLVAALRAIGSSKVPLPMRPDAPDSFPSAPLPLEGPHGRLGVLICGHGSRNRLAVGEFAALAEQLRRRLGPVPVAHGYLEFARPILRDGLDALRQQGVDHVLAVFPFERPLLERVSLWISERERVCLVGRNGEGKSSLLRLVAGATTPDDGAIWCKPGARLAFLPQDLDVVHGERVIDVVRSGLSI